MDYIKLSNRFWKLHKEAAFSTAEIALYFHLLSICNELTWKNPFQQSNVLLCASLGLSEKTLIAARAKLQTSGLLAFVPGHKRTPTTYRLAGHAALFSLEDTLENALENFQSKLQPIRELTPPDSASQLPNTLENVASSINQTSSVVENQTSRVGACEGQVSSLPESPSPGAPSPRCAAPSSPASPAARGVAAKLAAHWKITELRNARRWGQLVSFCRALDEAGQLAYLDQQFAAYAAHRQLRGISSHGLDTYLGHEQSLGPDGMPYADGAWTEKDWAAELADERHRQQQRPGATPALATKASASPSKQQSWD
ncbi:hypothetical protein [Hymenobacter sp. B81]|uniref:hypothetical protein n=1 Tax=Hymenobacter sp. B81 TaxID=3344878 RepID=UPI0037DD9B89